MTYVQRKKTHATVHVDTLRLHAVPLSKSGAVCIRVDDTYPSDDAAADILVHGEGQADRIDRAVSAFNAIMNERSVVSTKLLPIGSSWDTKAEREMDLAE